MLIFLLLRNHLTYGHMPQDKGAYFFLYFSTQTYALGTQKNLLNE